MPITIQTLEDEQINSIEVEKPQTIDVNTISDKVVIFETQKEIVNTFETSPPKGDKGEPGIQGEPGPPGTPEVEYSLIEVERENDSISNIKKYVDNSLTAKIILNRDTDEELLSLSYYDNANVLTKTKVLDRDINGNIIGIRLI